MREILFLANLWNESENRMKGHVTNAERKTESYPALTHRHGAKNVSVFGFHARGERRPESDTDFLVNMEGSLLQRIALIQDSEDMLGREADIVTEEGLGTSVNTS